MQALFWACAVAPKRLRRFAHAQNDLIWTAADATKLDLAAAPNGGSARDYLPGIAWFGALVMVRRASGCPYVYSSALSV
jgi:hypothetical protein